MDGSSDGRRSIDGNGGARLRSDQVLQRAANVRILLTGAGTCQVDVPGGMVEIGSEGLRVLERFAEPTSVRDALGGASQHGVQAWMDLATTIAGLLEHGVLFDVETGPTLEEVRRHGFDNPRSHIEMLDDAVRTSSFVAAVEATVRPGDVVVDVGTGTGILAMAAARAGAAEVYAIEAGAIAGAAEGVIAANGFADRVHVVRGWSTTVTLPRRADVLVTETLGSDPLDERILEIVTDARRRLLVPDARIVPSTVHIDATAVEIPDRDLASFVFTVDRARRWDADYGFDLRALVPSTRRLGGYRVPIDTARTWLPLAPPTRLASLSLQDVDATSVETAAETVAARSGRLDGALLHFEAELAPGIRISTSPRAAATPGSWSTVLTLCPSVVVTRGQRLSLTYRRNVRTAAPGLSVDTADPAPSERDRSATSSDVSRP